MNAGTNKTDVNSRLRSDITSGQHGPTSEATHDDGDANAAVNDV